MSTTTDEKMTNGAAALAEAVEGRVESHLHPTPSWDVDDHPIPTGREEIWRFTPISRLRALLADAPDAAPLAWSGEHPDVTIEPIDPTSARALAVRAPVDRIAALAADTDEHPVHLRIAPGVEIAEPIVFTGVGTGGQARDRFILTVGAHAKATVVLRYEGSAEYAEKVDVVVGDGATLNLVTLQDWDDDAVHGGQRSVLVGRDAHVKTVTATTGGHLVRLQEDARFAGPGGELEQYGLYFADAGQHVEHRLFVDHNAPKTSSNVDYRGCLQGDGAHTVWIGDVLIRKVAEGIETYEANKNLVLTEGCRADSVPNLEIETGEIAGAGHSSTTGRFDDEHLFYLTSRGIGPEEAKRLVVRGFFHDIVRRIGVTSIEEHLAAIVESELNKAIGTEGVR